MSTITPMLDTLLPQVLGRRAELQRFAGPRANMPLSPVAPVAPTRTDGFERPLPGTGAPTASADEPVTKPTQSKTAARGAPREAALQTRYAGPALRGDAGRHGESARPQLSREGGLIANLLAREAEASQARPNSALALFGAARVPPTPILASVLGQQVAQSGLFYESHLAKWFDGKHPGEQLREEPQNARDGEPDARARALPQAPARMAAPARLPVQTGATQTFAGTAGSQGQAGNEAGDEVVDDRLLTIVRQQLDVLSSTVFRWQGEAWPGVPMQWQIHEQGGNDDHKDPGEAEAQAGRFSTRLSLDLPRLGRLEVVLDLAGDRIDVYACAASAPGTAAIAPATAALEQRFQQAGFAAAHVELIEALDDE